MNDSDDKPARRVLEVVMVSPHADQPPSKFFGQLYQFQACVSLGHGSSREPIVPCRWQRGSRRFERVVACRKNPRITVLPEVIRCGLLAAILSGKGFRPPNGSYRRGESGPSRTRCSQTVLPSLSNPAPEPQRSRFRIYRTRIRYPRSRRPGPHSRPSEALRASRRFHPHRNSRKPPQIPVGACPTSRRKACPCPLEHARRTAR